MKEKVDCAIYTRVSTDNQAEVEFSSCEAQKNRIEYFIKSQVGFRVYDVFNDEGYSGKDLNRPALQKMLCEIEMRNIDCVITYKMDRLTRSPKDFYQLIELFDKYEVDFISVTERFDTSTPSGRLLRNIMLTFAQFERELASERTRDKLIQMAQKGMWNGGLVPYGYKNIDKKLIIVKKEAEIVREIFIIFIQTKSIVDVYNHLKEKGIMDRSGQSITKNGISYILTNVKYTGRIKYAGKIYKGIHEAIISDEIFNEAQQYLKKRIRKWRQYKTFLFGGLVKCKECNSAMSPTFTNKPSKGEMKIKRYYYYRCQSTFKKNWGCCSIKQVNANRLEDYVFNCLKRMTVDRHYLYSSSLERGARVMLEKNQLWPEEEVKSSQKYIKDFVFAAEKISGTEKCQYIRNYVRDIIYSKETIQVNLYWRDHLDNKRGNLGQASEKLHTRPQDNGYKYRITDGEIQRENTNVNEKDAGSVGDDPRRSAEGRGAEGVNRRSVSEGGIYPSEERSSERGFESQNKFLLNGLEPKNLNLKTPEFIFSN